MSAKKVTKKVTSPAARSDRMNFGSAAEMQSYLRESAEQSGLDRMVPRDAPANDQVEDDDASEPEVLSSAAGVWGSKPSVADQLLAHPTSIRTKAPVTAQFVLSDPDQLAKWNLLQARMHPPSAPQVRLDVYESEFAHSVGSYVLLVTYSEIEYQQLI